MYTPQYGRDVKCIPILSRRCIDDIAEGFLADYQPEALRKPMPIDIDRFLEMYLGVTPDYQFLSHNMVYLGMTVFHDTTHIPVFDPSTNHAEYLCAKANTVIFDTRLVEEANQEHRYRFTGGHEAGHVIFHRPYFDRLDRIRNRLGITDALYTQCRDAALNKTSKRKLQTDSDWLEWQANQFSSSLLMPRSTVMSFVDNYGYTKNGLFHVLVEMESAFNVSAAAAMNRLKNLGILKKSVAIDIGLIAQE